MAEKCRVGVCGYDPVLVRLAGAERDRGVCCHWFSNCTQTGGSGLQYCPLVLLLSCCSSHGGCIARHQCRGGLGSLWFG